MPAGSLISIDESQDNGQAELHLFTPGSDHVAEVVQTIEGFTGADLQVRQITSLA